MKNVSHTYIYMYIYVCGMSIMTWEIYMFPFRNDSIRITGFVTSMTMMEH